MVVNAIVWQRINQSHVEREISTAMRYFTLLLGCCFLVACNQPTTPSAVQESVAQSPPTPLAVTVSFRTMSLTTPPVQQFQAIAEAWFAAGRQDITTDATWTSSNQEVATISPTGVVTWLGTGTTVIRASYRGISSQDRPISYINCGTHAEQCDGQ